MQRDSQTYKVDGDIVSTNASLHWSRIESIIQNVSENGILNLDLRASRLVDSVGLNVIVKAIKTVAARKARVRMLIGNNSLKRICTFTRLDQKAEIVGP
ncbi:STAS domain-containing protein [Pelagicoccus sp. SDUM812002]|uniref:STAS domain-containing protein n=1 Tax=Pelagicoccus sp. SDUM812002 TaxID=3041266 RepID=UPI00280D8379|nr:STAS domain-containing protein [Pelagicoccus sp. SDUM812002]MDQ8184779.1 STAS domain-containing protein [Pelagicoccus sp. SDUM812002]